MTERNEQNASSTQMPGQPQYVPFDQDAHLPRPPWKPSQQLHLWETAHGHDARLKCYPEFGCQVIEPYAYWCGWRDRGLGVYAPEEI